MRRPLRVVLAVFAGGLVVACGIEIVGTMQPRPDEADGGDDDGSPFNRDGSSDASDEEDESIVYLDAQPIFDALLDTNPENCFAVCEAGVGVRSCNGGTCVIECGANGCQGAPVVCPAGVPCDVRCSGSSSCNQGVDCTAASRCTIGCTGANACQTGAVACTGDSCVVNCSGSTSCNKAVACDAGSCIINCVAQNACQNDTVRCDSEVCTVQCGESKDKGTVACNKGVTCHAQDRCTIACLAKNTCQNQLVVAQAQNVNVLCREDQSCNQGVAASAADASILCRKAGSCGSGVYCDGGNCFAECDDTGNDAMKFCCKAPTACDDKNKKCDWTTGGCP